MYPESWFTPGVVSHTPELRMNRNPTPACSEDVNFSYKGPSIGGVAKVAALVIVSEQATASATKIKRGDCMATARLYSKDRAVHTLYSSTGQFVHVPAP